MNVVQDPTVVAAENKEKACCGCGGCNGEAQSSTITKVKLQPYMGVDVLVGVDDVGSARPILSLISRLMPEKSSILLLHAVDSVVALPGNAPIAPETRELYTKTVQNLGLNALDAARLYCHEIGLHVKSKLVFGQPAAALLSETAKTDADLVALNANHTGSWSTSFLGSVSRAVSIYSSSNVLVSKGDLKGTGPISAVFATDHSAYAWNALIRFIGLGFKGISDIHVVSAYDIDDSEATALSANLAMYGGDIDRYLVDAVTERNLVWCEKLEEAGYRTSESCQRGHANNAIRNAMESTGADLLIVAAQGSGFMEEALIGSVALHQVVAEPYPVLIIRSTGA